MNDPLVELRAAVAVEFAGIESDPTVDLPPSGILDDALVAYFIQRDPSDTFQAAIVEFTDVDDMGPAPAGLAAARAAAPQPARAISVDDALRLPMPAARVALEWALGVGADAASELLERPAAALAQRRPAEIRHLAALARRREAELFSDIAESWRASAGYAYAYRPGHVAEEPATTPEGASLAPLLTWGAELLGVIGSD